MNDVFDVFYAFCQVYYSEMTASGDFQMLLDEMLKIMATISDGSFEKTEDKKDEGKMLSKLFKNEKCVIFTKSDMESFKKSLEEKAGKVISAKNAEIIKNAVTSLEVAGSSLNEVLALSEDKSVEVAPTEETADNKISDGEAEKKELVKIATKSLMRVLQLSNQNK